MSDRVGIAGLKVCIISIFPTSMLFQSRGHHGGGGNGRRPVRSTDGIADFGGITGMEDAMERKNPPAEKIDETGPNNETLVHPRRLELPQPFGHYHLKVARIPFRHERINIDGGS